MSKTHLVIPDSHAHYKHNNNRAEWVGKLIRDIKPDVVVDLGDSADMPSLADMDKGKRTFQGRTYQKDIEAHNDFHDRLWNEVKKSKKKLPLRVTLHGNHEHRIDRALDNNPALEGVISYDDLNLDRWYDVVVPYTGGTPGVIDLDGVHYAHYFVSGVMGRAISGEHPAYTLLSKKHVSCTAGHLHTFDYCTRTRADGQKIMGLVAGCYQDYDSEWAGEICGLWDKGVVVKRGVEKGCYDLEWISIERLKKEYGS